MTTRRLSIVINALVFLGLIPAVQAQEPPPPEVPAAVQIEDPAGDANYLNDQGVGLPLEGDQTTPQDLTISDLLKIWWTNDAETISVHFQTEAPPPSSNAAYLFRAFTNPGGDFPDGCLWWEAVVEGPTFVGEAFARLRDMCSETDPVEGTISIATLEDETGVVTVTVPRDANAAFAPGGTIATPIAEVRNVTGAAAARFATAPVVDNTKPGTDYTITDEEPEPQPKKKKKKKGKTARATAAVLTGGSVRAL
ncbi:MAG: hypothetical protein M3277_01475 [Actinomycetota bacterium]|nr:hypothetical protein [Actinomycetota bacterium]